MKPIKQMIILVFIFIPILSFSQNRQNETQKKNEKVNTKKLAKKNSKEAKKNGYEGVCSRGMETCWKEYLDNYYSSVDYKEVQSIVVNCSSVNQCRQKAPINASVEISNKWAAQLKSIVTGNVVLDETNPENIDKFIQFYTVSANTQLLGLLKDEFQILKRNNNTYELKSYYIYSESEAKRINKNAIQDAVKKSNIHLKEAEGINDLVEKIVK